MTKAARSNRLLWLVAIGFFYGNAGFRHREYRAPEYGHKSWRVSVPHAIRSDRLFSDNCGLDSRLRMGGRSLWNSKNIFLCDPFIYFRLLMLRGFSEPNPTGDIASFTRNWWRDAHARRTTGCSGRIPHQEFLRAISFVTIPALIGPLIGPTLGGWLVQFASWHWIFLINIPVGIIGCIATYIDMPDIRGPEKTEFDFAGFLMLSASMVMISFALDGLSELGFQQATVLLLVIFGLSTLAAYWLHARRYARPLFSLRLFSSQTYSIGLLGNLFARIGSSSMPFLIPIFLQISLGYSPFDAGMTMIPVALAGIYAKRLATPLILRWGYRQTLVLNTLCVGIMMASFALITVEQPKWMRILQLLIFGTVNSLQFTAMNTLTLKDLETRLASSGNSLFSMVQMLAMSFGVAAAGALLSTFTQHYGPQEGGGMALQAFRATFLCMGLITCSSAWIFWQLPTHDQSQ